MEIEKFLNEPVEDLFKRRVANCLIGEGILTLNSLKEKNFKTIGEIESFLLRIPNFARKSLRDFYVLFKEENIDIKYLFLNTEEKIKISMDDILKLHYKSIEKFQIILDDLRDISFQFKNAMDIQCRAHLTQLKLAIQEWENKHK